MFPGLWRGGGGGRVIVCSGRKDRSVHVIRVGYSKGGGMGSGGRRGGTPMRRK